MSSDPSPKQVAKPRRIGNILASVAFWHMKVEEAEELIATAIFKAVEDERFRFKDMMGRYETMLVFSDGQRQRFAYEMRQELSFYLDNPSMYEDAIKNNTHPFSGSKKEVSTNQIDGLEGLDA